MVFLKLIPMILFYIIYTLFQPFFWLVILIIWFQFKRMARMKSALFHVPEDSVVKPTIMATAYGLIGGFLGSIVLVFVGVSVYEIGIQYLWLLAIGLMLIRQRFMCFAYAGGLLGLLNYFFGFPQISIPQVMGLVAILHLVESFLILISGHLGAIPVYLKNKGQLIGGFNLQKFWPLPIVAMMAQIAPPTTDMTSILNMPDWWPLIKSQLISHSENLVYIMVPVVAGLGYGDIALTAKPKKKSSQSAVNLGIYSMVLLFLSILANYLPELGILPALFAPLGHEYVIYLGRKSEFNGIPKFVAPEKGVMILDLATNSPLKKSGLDTGDIIVGIDEYPVNHTYDLQHFLQFADTNFHLEYLDDEDKVLKRVLVQRKNLTTDLGIITVPEGYTHAYLNFSNESSSLRKWLKKFLKK